MRFIAIILCLFVFSSCHSEFSKVVRNMSLEQRARTYNKKHPSTYMQILKYIRSIYKLKYGDVFENRYHDYKNTGIPFEKCKEYCETKDNNCLCRAERVSWKITQGYQWTFPNAPIDEDEIKIRYSVKDCEELNIERGYAGETIMVGNKERDATSFDNFYCYRIF